MNTTGNRYVHGHTAGGKHTRTFRIWTNMLTRCQNPRASNYAYYGGRGIAVCERWLEFSAFLADMGECPDGQSIDRIDSNGNYEPANCRWATKQEQANNTRRSRILSIDGHSMTMAQASRAYGVSVGVIWARLKLGWSDAQSVGADAAPPRRFWNRHAGRYELCAERPEFAEATA